MRAARGFAARRYGTCIAIILWTTVGRCARGGRGCSSPLPSLRGTSLDQGRVGETRKGLFRARSGELHWIRGIWGSQGTRSFALLKGIHPGSWEGGETRRTYSVLPRGLALGQARGEDRCAAVFCTPSGGLLWAKEARRRLRVAGEVPHMD